MKQNIHFVYIYIQKRLTIYSHTINLFGTIRRCFHLVVVRFDAVILVEYGIYLSLYTHVHIYNTSV